MKSSVLKYWRKQLLIEFTHEVGRLFSYSHIHFAIPQVMINLTSNSINNFFPIRRILDIPFLEFIGLISDIVPAYPHHLPNPRNKRQFPSPVRIFLESELFQPVFNVIDFSLVSGHDLVFFQWRDHQILDFVHFC